MSSIEGLDELLDQLDGLEEAVLEGAQHGLARGLKITVGEAKALCPVDTGQLRNSITSMVERKLDRVDGQVLATARHAVYVEMGTGPVGQANHQGVAPVPVTYRVTPWVYPMKTNKGIIFRHTRGMPARPFMYPAYKQTRRRILAEVKRCVEEKLREV